MKILIADDLPATHTYLKDLLRDVAGINLLGVAQDAKEATDLALSWEPDVLILDIHMRGGRGIDVVQAVKAAKPASVVIISTIMSSADIREAVLKRGADLFFDKSIDLEKVAGVLRAMKLRAAPEPKAA
jgi:DNA-binding NarL/FixJ family response regulator